MFKLNEVYEQDRSILMRDYIRYSSSGTSTINTPNSQLSIDKPTEDSVSSLINKYLVSIFEVVKNNDNAEFADGLI